MSFAMSYSKIWTYNCLIPNSEKVSIESLSNYGYTHIHGDLVLYVDDVEIPQMCYKSSGVCFGVWIKEFIEMLQTVLVDCGNYTIEGLDQGLPAFLFERNKQKLNISIVDSIVGGRAREDWQRVPIMLEEFKHEFIKFKIQLLDDIGKRAPEMLEVWSKKFTITPALKQRWPEYDMQI